MSKRSQSLSPTIVFAEFCKPPSMKSQPNPLDRDIALLYYQLRGLTLNELSRIIRRWNLRDDCTGEMLILRSADHPNAMMIAAGRLLAERLGITVDRVSWQPLELHS